MFAGRSRAPALTGESMICIHQELLALDAANNAPSRHLHRHLTAWDVCHADHPMPGKSTARRCRTKCVKPGKFRRGSLEDVRLDSHRTDDRHTDPLGAEGSAKPLLEAHHGELRCRIRAPQSWSHQAGGRGDSEGIILDVECGEGELPGFGFPSQKGHWG